MEFPLTNTSSHFTREGAVRVTLPVQELFASTAWLLYPNSRLFDVTTIHSLLLVTELKGSGVRP